MFDNIHQILHPTDFSDPAQNAFTYAVEIAHRSDAQLLVMHSAKSPYVYGSDIMMEEIISQNRYKDLEIETKIEVGKTISAIIDSAGDLIVMGTTGKTNVAEIIFGSISSEVMLKSPVPVLVIPPEQRYSDFNRIIFATDYHDKDLENLQHLIKLAELFNAEITVLHIATKDNLKSQIMFRGFREIAQETIDESSITFQFAFDDDFYSGLNAYLNSQSDDLIVMTRNKKSFFQSLTGENHIQRTVHENIPLLVLPGEETLKETAEP